MTDFWLLASLMALAAAFFVLAPVFSDLFSDLFSDFWRASSGSSAGSPFGQKSGQDRERLNVALFQERIAEFEVQKSRGELTEDELAELQLDARRDLLGDAASTPSSAPLSDRAADESGDEKGDAEPRPTKLLPLVIAALFVPLAAMILYAGPDFMPGYSGGAIKEQVLTERALAAMDAGDSVAAIRWFQLALAEDPEGRSAQIFRQLLEQMRAERMQSQPETSDGQVPDEKASDKPMRFLEINIEAGEAVDLPDASTVFVYARAAAGPPAPLAVKRLTLGDLPARVRLDETMAMLPGMGLANFDEVIVVARISSTGGVSAAPDDFEARSEVMNLTQPIEPLTLKINSKVGSNF